MIYDFNLAYPYIFIFLVLVLLAVAGYRWFIWQPVRYTGALTSYFMKQGLVSKKHLSQYLIYFTRLLALLLLALVLARPQGIDPKSQVKVEGVDIVLVLDVSNSMLLFDDPQNPQTRIDVAKKEAINFINKRENDPIGLVLFGRYAVSRCPLTLDKELLKQMIDQIEIGEIDPVGTFLSIAMMTAINRLKYSQAKSRIMIVLTDGQPSDGDLDPDTVIDISKKLDIKIYTIGIGSQDGGYSNHPLFGVIKNGETFNQKLLEQVANETGGQCFQAQNANDMRQIYNKIDQLERSSQQSTVFTKKHEFFSFFIKLALLLLLLELCLSYFIWFGIA